MFLAFFAGFLICFLHTCDLEAMVPGPMIPIWTGGVGGQERTDANPIERGHMLNGKPWKLELIMIAMNKPE